MVTFRLVIFTGSARERRQGSPEVGLKWERPRDTTKSRAEAVQTLRDRLAAEIPQGHSSTLEHRQDECPRAYVTMTDRSSKGENMSTEMKQAFNANGELVDLATATPTVTRWYTALYVPEDKTFDRNARFLDEAAFAACLELWNNDQEGIWTYEVWVEREIEIGLYGKREGGGYAITVGIDALRRLPCP